MPGGQAGGGAMTTVPVGLGPRSYDIRIGPGLIDRPEEFDAWIGGRQVFIITNDVVAPLYVLCDGTPRVQDAVLRVPADIQDSQLLHCAVVSSEPISRNYTPVDWEECSGLTPNHGIKSLS